MAAALWAEASDEDRDEREEVEKPGEVDDSFASRKLRRWLKGMFGGGRADEQPTEREED